MCGQVVIEWKDDSHAAWPPRCKELGRLLCAGSGPHMAFYAPAQPDGGTVSC